MHRDFNNIAIFDSTECIVCGAAVYDMGVCFAQHNERVFQNRNSLLILNSPYKTMMEGRTALER